MLFWAVQFCLILACHDEPLRDFPSPVKTNRRPQESTPSLEQQRLHAELSALILPGIWTIDQNAYLIDKAGKNIPNTISYDAFIERLVKAANLDGMFDIHSLQWAFLNKQNDCDGNNLGYPQLVDEFQVVPISKKRAAILQAAKGQVVRGPFVPGGPWVFQGKYDHSKQGFPIRIQMNSCSPWDDSCNKSGAAVSNAFPLTTRLPSFKMFFEKNTASGGKAPTYIQTRNVSSFEFFWHIPAILADKYKQNPVGHATDFEVQFAIEVTGMGFNKYCQKDCEERLKRLYSTTQEGLSMQQDFTAKECTWRGFGGFFTGVVRHLIVKREGQIIHAHRRLMATQVDPPHLRIVIDKPQNIAPNSVTGTFSFTYLPAQKKRKRRRKYKSKMIKGKGEWSIRPGEKIVNLKAPKLPISHLELENIVHQLVDDDIRNPARTTLKNRQRKWTLRRFSED